MSKTAKDCHAPRLSGLPKIHKEGVPLRGIVSTVGSPFERISRYLIPILRTIQGRSGLFVKNSRQLKERVKEWRVEGDEILVSYDVKSLYPSIPIKKALELVEKLLKENTALKDVTNLSVDSIMDLLKWMFNLTYCEYNGQHFVLGNGPIGLGATGEIAIIYMEEWQRKAREGIESLREQQSGRETLNNFEQLTEWRTVLNSYFKQEMTKMRTTSRARNDHVG